MKEMKLIIFVLFSALIGANCDCDINTKFDFVHIDSTQSENGVTVKSYHNTPTKTDLKLSNGQLGSLCKEFLEHFKDKETLIIDNFGITRFTKNAFAEFNNLKHLEINNNYIIEIPQNVFTNDKLHTLILKGNGITTIGRSAFKLLPNLKKLDLSSNGLPYIYPTWFKYNPILSNINFDNNLIESLDDDDFSNLQFANTCTTECPSISIRYNEIDNLDAGVFKGLKKISSLNLEYNRIYELQYFNDVTIDTINMQYNIMDDVDQIALDNLGGTELLLLFGNTLTERSISNIDEYNKNNGKHIYYDQHSKLIETNRV